jgi:hypothetical protein
MKFYGRDRGSCIMGTTGSVIVDRGGYEVYDLNGKQDSSEVKAGKRPPRPTVGRDSMTDLHFANFIAAVQNGEKLNARRGRQRRRHHAAALQRFLGSESHPPWTPPMAKILNDPAAMKYWGREYEPAGRRTSESRTRRCFERARLYSFLKNSLRQGSTLVVPKRCTKRR